MQVKFDYASGAIREVAEGTLYISKAEDKMLDSIIGRIGSMEQVAGILAQHTSADEMRLIAKILGFLVSGGIMVKPTPEELSGEQKEREENFRKFFNTLFGGLFDTND